MMKKIILLMVLISFNLYSSGQNRPIVRPLVKPTKPITKPKPAIKPILTMPNLVIFSGEICNNKKILNFANLSDIQNEHTRLYQDYINGNEEEQILINYEKLKHFYSLRAKDYDMDYGIIPDDANFNPFNYTTDEILETLLNQDGMVIIDNYLYLWDDGCIIHKVPFSCENYEALLEYKNLVSQINNQNSQTIQVNIYNLKKQYKIVDIEICNDARFDFESISETGIKIDNRPDSNTILKSSGCGYDVFINHELLANDPINKKISYRISYSYITPPSTPRFQTFYISNPFEGMEVKIVSGSIPGVNWNNVTWNEGDTAYPGEWFQVEVDYSQSTAIAPSLHISLSSHIELLNGNSCSSQDDLDINLLCPITISKHSINAQNGEWSFAIQGLNNVSGYVVNWNFGDGNSETTTNISSTTHQYAIPCQQTNYTVTATIEAPNLCKTFLSENKIQVGDPCKRSKISRTFNDKINSRKLRIKTKLKKILPIFNSNSKIKHKFRWRVTGDKTISNIGNIYESIGTNCNLININSILSDKTTSGKKKNKNVLKSNIKYLLDITNSYNVIFSHSNGFSHTINFNSSCSQ